MRDMTFEEALDTVCGSVCECNLRFCLHDCHDKFGMYWDKNKRKYVEERTKGEDDSAEYRLLFGTVM